MNYAFTHIGMFKTATTYMQNLWLNNDNYNLSWQGNIKFLKEVRNRVAIEKSLNDLAIELNTDPQRVEGNNLIISNEGFSGAYINQLNNQSKGHKFINEISKILGCLEVTNDKLLIVVRDPLSWIKSAFTQAIKQGWDGNTQKFVDEQKLFLFNSLDFRYIYQSYNRYFNNILVLPFELLKDDEDKLWQIISDKFNVPLVNNRMQKLNVSLDDKRIFLLSKMNEMSNRTVNILADSNSYKNEREKNNIINGYNQSKMWVHRRFVEHAKEKEINELYQVFNLSKNDISDDFYHFELPKKLIDGIENNYFNALEGKIEDKYLKDYRKKFIKKLI
jgi:hypothetical protein